MQWPEMVDLPSRCVLWSDPISLYLLWRDMELSLIRGTSDLQKRSREALGAERSDWLVQYRLNEQLLNDPNRTLSADQVSMCTYATSAKCDQVSHQAWRFEFVSLIVFKGSNSWIEYLQTLATFWACFPIQREHVLNVQVLLQSPEIIYDDTQRWAGVEAKRFAHEEIISWFRYGVQVEQLTAQQIEIVKKARIAAEHHQVMLNTSLLDHWPEISAVVLVIAVVWWLWNTLENKIRQCLGLQGGTGVPCAFLCECVGGSIGCCIGLLGRCLSWWATSDTSSTHRQPIPYFPNPIATKYFERDESMRRSKYSHEEPFQLHV